MEIDGKQVYPRASMGICMSDEDLLNQDAEELLRNADVAMYMAKRDTKGRYRLFEPAMHERVVERLELRSELQRALDEGQLEVYYQPVVRLSGGDQYGVEALLRWHHPTRGLVAPGAFIPLAEETGLIMDLGDWVIDEACRAASVWPDYISVALNLSAKQLIMPALPNTVSEALSKYRLKANRLELEVTETTLLGNVEAAEMAMRRLKALGVRLALDDFGTGYSSLLYLRRFPFDKLKIDSSFVRSIDRAADAAAIVHAVVSLGRGLGMSVTAEGVETADQQLFLRAAGVHSMQGYRFGRPCRAEELVRRLAEAQFSSPLDDTKALALAG